MVDAAEEFAPCSMVCVDVSMMTRMFCVGVGLTCSLACASTSIAALACRPSGRRPRKPPLAAALAAARIVRIPRVGLSDLLRQADAVRYAAEDSSREAMADLLDRSRCGWGPLSVPRRSWSGHERSVKPPFRYLVGATLGLGLGVGAADSAGEVGGSSSLRPLRRLS